MTGIRNVITVTEAARISGYSTGTIRYALNKGLIEGEKQGGTWVVVVPSLMKWIASRPDGDKKPGWPAGVSRCPLCGGMDKEGHYCPRRNDDG